MRKRNVPIMFRLNKKEAELLDKKVKRCGLTREAYLRHLVAGFAPKEAPPPDYYSMMRELYGIGRNLNQIAQKAHALDVIDAGRYDTEARKLEAAVKKITDSVILPGSLENTGFPRSRLRGEKEHPCSDKPSASYGQKRKAERGVTWL